MILHNDLVSFCQYHTEMNILTEFSEDQIENVFIFKTGSLHNDLEFDLDYP